MRQTVKHNQDAPKQSHGLQPLRELLPTAAAICVSQFFVGSEQQCPDFCHSDAQSRAEGATFWRIQYLSTTYSWQLKQPVPTLSWLMLEESNPSCDGTMWCCSLINNYGEKLYFFFFLRVG